MNQAKASSAALQIFVEMPTSGHLLWIYVLTCLRQRTFLFPPQGAIQRRQAFSSLAVDHMHRRSKVCAQRADPAQLSCLQRMLAMNGLLLQAM